MLISLSTRLFYHLPYPFNHDHDFSGVVRAMGGGGSFGPRIIPSSYAIDSYPIASIGTGTPSPSGINGHFNISSCPSYATACAFDLTVTLTEPLQPGEMMIFSHSSLRRTSVLSSTLSGALSGNGSQRFQGMWRQADATYNLGLGSAAIGLESRLVFSRCHDAIYHSLCTFRPLSPPSLPPPLSPLSLLPLPLTTPSPPFTLNIQPSVPCNPLALLSLVTSNTALPISAPTPTSPISTSI